MTKKRLLIKRGRVYRPDTDPHNPSIADILIEGSTIKSIDEGGIDAQEEPDFDVHVIDATGKLVMPGFVNAHYHSNDFLLKGFFEPMPLEIWFLNISSTRFPPRSREEVRVRTMLGAVECIRNGITTIQDMITIYPMEDEYVSTILEAYQEVGIRLVFAISAMDTPPLAYVPYWKELIPKKYWNMVGGTSINPRFADKAVAFIEDQYLKGKDSHDQIQWALAPSSPERCSRRLLEKFSDLSEKYDLPIYTHIYISKPEALNARQNYSEYGGSLISYLDDIGLLNERLSLAHGVWMSPGEIEAMAGAKANIILNIMSNLKNKNGVAPIRQFIKAGINIGLGCDNCSCSDAQNMFQAMKMFSLLAAVSDPVPGSPTAVDAIAAATINGACTANMQDRIGTIEPGMKADLAIYDLSDPAFVPLNSVARQFVYSECGRAVETVIVNGQAIMKNRKMMTVDEAALHEAVNESMQRLRKDAGDLIKKNEQIKEILLEADHRSWQHDIKLQRYLS